MASLSRCLCAATSTMRSPCHSREGFRISTSSPWSSLHQLLFRGLCLISVRRPSLEAWTTKYSDQEWDMHMSQLVGQINSNSVECGILSAAAAVFLTTPPPLQSVPSHATTPSCVLVLVSFAYALGSILTGTAVIATRQSCGRIRSREASNHLLMCTTSSDAVHVLSATRLCFYLILLLMVWRSVSVSVDNFPYDLVNTQRDPAPGCGGAEAYVMDMGFTRLHIYPRESRKLIKERQIKTRPLHH
ncbi:hypothetical protein DFJ58DRAFT_220171 [Suillus subalutaceus]|uniref:uncharacterized protein n=1 Tax=Suillus subalutaceus TaxID=48586 RepID=UPI001B87843F|nr:uncharacterized protein DFJ58DRAFT_220171 [Suillus subalutaceus]KAG1863177.1 hypothetical protein DFJ58DRAFT_220171 [Suillus subalutaceus]